MCNVKGVARIDGPTKKTFTVQYSGGLRPLQVKRIRRGEKTPDNEKVELVKTKK